MKIKQCLFTSLLVIAFSAAVAQTAKVQEKQNLKLPGYTDWVTIHVGDYIKGYKFLRVSTNGLQVDTSYGCSGDNVVGKKCVLSIRGGDSVYGSVAAVTIGKEDWSDYCQFFFRDGPSNTSLTYDQLPVCKSSDPNRKAAQYLQREGMGSNYYTYVW